MHNYRIEKVFGTSGSFAGIAMASAGLIVSVLYDLTGLFLFIPGLFMGFTYEGTRIDPAKRRIMNYTSIFGLIALGKWYDIDTFNRFTIYRSTKRGTLHSRGNVPLDLKISDIRLALLSRKGKVKVTVNRFRTFEEARTHMSWLITELRIQGMEEWKADR